MSFLRNDIGITNSTKILEQLIVGFFPNMNLISRLILELQLSFTSRSKPTGFGNNVTFQFDGALLRLEA